MEALITFDDMHEGGEYPRSCVGMGDIQGLGHRGYEHTGQAWNRQVGMYWSLCLPLPGLVSIHDWSMDRTLTGGRLFRAVLIRDFVPGWMDYPTWRFRWFWGVRG